MLKLSHLPALALLVALSACGAKEAKRPPGTPEVGYVVMTTQTVPLEIELAGRTTAYETSEVRPQVAGVIRARNFVEGSIVRQGQTLYEIDPSLYRAAVAQAEANLANAQAVREAAEAKAALDTARINLRFTRVPAPISGRIGRSLVTTGALVTTGQADPLTSIQRLDPIFVDIQQSSAELVALRRELSSGGATRSPAVVRLTLEDGSQYALPGRVQFAEAVVNENTGTVTLRATFPNPSGLLLPGMYVRARFSQATAQNAILAPQQGVSRDPRGNATVYLVGPGNKALLRTITASRTVGDKWLVTAGLAPGDKVITEGLDNVKPGEAVRPVPAGSPPRQHSPAPDSPQRKH